MRWVKATLLVLLIVVNSRSTPHAEIDIRPVIEEVPIRRLILAPPPAQFGPRRTLDDVLNDVIERR